MKNKSKSKTPPWNPSFLPRLGLIPDIITWSPWAEQGDREWGLQSAHYTFSFLLRDRIPHILSWTSVQELLQHESFPWTAVLNELPQCGYPTGSQVLPAHTLQRGLFSPWAHKSCQESAPMWASHGVTAFFGHPPVLMWGFPWVAGESLLHNLYFIWQWPWCILGTISHMLSLSFHPCCCCSSSFPLS